MNFAKQLRAEILRLSARAARQVATPLRRTSAAQRRQIAALRRQVAALERQIKLQGSAARRNAAAAAETPEKIRFVAKGLVSLRKRLGLSAADFGRLVGASGQSVYAWESRKTVPRKSQIAAIAAIRGLGKREALARLEQAAG